MQYDSKAHRANQQDVAVQSKPDCQEVEVQTHGEATGVEATSKTNLEWPWRSRYATMSMRRWQCDVR